MYDYVSLSLAVPACDVANVKYNTEKIIEKLDEVKDNKSDIVAFPALSVTSATCGDLFLQRALIKSAAKAVGEICGKSREVKKIIIIGAPLQIDNCLYNCGVVICDGEIMGIVPKTFLSYEEKRWFSSAAEITKKWVTSKEIGVCDEEYVIPVGNDLVFSFGDEKKFSVELGGEAFAPVSPSVIYALSGAQIIVNIASEYEAAEKRNERRALLSAKSRSCLCAYAFVNAGADESTTDFVFSGHALMCEKGKAVAENEGCIDNDYVLTAEVDTGKIDHDRKTDKAFKDAYNLYLQNHSIREVVIDRDFFLKSEGENVYVRRLAFVPDEKEKRVERCLEIFEMQTAGLAKRLKKTGAKPVIGISGGLDSTLALLVCVNAAKKIGMPLSDIHGITMPCFGTSDRTYNNSLELMKTLGITYLEIPIKEAVLQHFKDIGHDKDTYDLTFENSQARERTQVLMDYSGKVGGFVVGTGDLSELALGWCTYNGDHMSMYAVNGGVPKTLIRWIIESTLEKGMFTESADVLKDVLDTPISPELLPPDETGKIAQKTESLVGPYALSDFFLYYVLRYGFEPSKVYFLAKKAFGDTFDNETILKWLKTFYRRFFTQQFKRSCQPDGVKVGSVGLSPRGDLKMPGDASFALWLDEAEKLI